MEATQLQTLLMFPGAQIEKRGKEGTILFDMGDYLEDCCVLYSVERNKIVDLDDVKTDIEGKLSETLFGIISLQEIGAFVYPKQTEWLVDWFKDCGWDSLGEDNMGALYLVARGKIPSEGGAIALEVNAVELSFYYQVSFIAVWGVNTSTDYESGFTEVDSIDFSHEGAVVEK